MKKLLVLLTILLVAGYAKAQTYVFQSFDNSVAGGWWDMANMYNNQGDATAKFDVKDVNAGQKEGSGCVQVNYTVGAGEGWGGYIVRTSVKPLPNGQVLDLSTGTHLNFWYKVVNPAVMTKPGSMVVEFKICDIQNGAEDRIFREIPVDLTDASGQWKQASVDYTMGTDKTVSWAYQANDGDRELAWEHINGFEVAIVYGLGGAGSSTNTPTATGSVMFDGFSVSGDHYAPPALSFLNQSASFASTWASGTGKVTLTDQSTDVVDGTTGAMKVDYTCDASEGWGGVMGFEIHQTPPKDILNRTGLTFFVKNVTPCVTSVPKRAILRVYIYEGDNGEQWVTKVPIDLTTASGWTRYRLPLKQGVNGNNNSDQYPPVGAFALNPNGPKDNLSFDPDKMSKIKFEVLAIGAGGPDSGPQGEKLVGTMLFGPMQYSGYQIVDKTAPAAPANFSVVKGNFSNLISWSDVANEGTEKYYVYASKSPITDINAAGVEQIAGQIVRGTQVYEHLLRTPQTNKDVTYYYAINAIDKAGNVGAFSKTVGITNTAKGVPTIYYGTVTNFKADGDLSEWKALNIAPWKLRLSDGSEHVMNGFKVDNDADLSADVYVALDANYLYAAFDVTDDIVYADDDRYMSSGTNWALDCTEIEFGYYNQEKAQHTAYKRGTHPDYHLRFNKVRARQDHWTAEKDSLLLPGPDYYWQEKFPTGYVVEARVSLQHLATWRKASSMTKDTLGTPLVEGTKIPFDIVIADNDGKNSTDLGSNREGQISWSPFNNDNGWWGPHYWMYTWLGNKELTGVKEEQVPFSYTLSQNYPNPFNPTTQIKYAISKAGNVNLKIYDMLGRVVSELVNQEQQPGNYSVRFDASKLASGVYFYRIESGSFVSVKKMMLIK